MRTTFVQSLIVLALVASGLIGCKEGSAAKPGDDSAKPRAAGPSAAGGKGVIRGVVSLKGEPPEMREIANQPCHAGATPIRAQQRPHAARDERAA